MKQLKSKVIVGNATGDIEQKLDKFLYNKNIKIITVNQSVDLDNLIILTIIYSTEI